MATAKNILHQEVIAERRAVSLTDADWERLRAELANRPPIAASCAESCVYRQDSTHDDHHEVLKRWIENDNRRKERYEKMRASVATGLILAALGAAGTACLNAITYLKEHLK